ncbi:UPF0605 protein CG18335-like [Venturia canescens]|uniref:UPF0605 protein CG18335-like n=1 Tax=Venturia canescens TaxID=32260 RepID=UPI001C9D35FB|nr:UPF0605 protein CG18335-like [Venturia canescens]
MAGAQEPSNKESQPGNPGCCPHYRYRCGETYGGLARKSLYDPTSNQSEELVFSNRVSDDYEIQRPAKNDIDIVNSRFKRTDPIYKYPLVPRYEGFMPNIKGILGQRFTVEGIEGLAEFERQQLRNREASNQLHRISALQNDRGEPRNVEDRLLAKSEFKLPLIAIRPDCVGAADTLTIDEQCETPRDHAPSPYFMENTNPEKYFVSGYTGHIPYGYAHFGATHSASTNSALCDFTTNYRIRQSTEWAPVTISRPDPPILLQPTEKYHKNIGLIPNYFGHVPGANFRFGKTFGCDTKDAKRWLRGDFTV